MAAARRFVSVDGWFTVLRAICCMIAVAGAVAFFAMTFSAAAFGAKNDSADDEEPAKLAGLVASYSVNNGAAPLFRRYESVPTFLLAAGETPDPRLRANGWHGQWDGVIQILHPGKYRFSAIHSGPLKIVLNGKTVFDEAAAAKEPAPDAGVELAFGVVPIQVQFEAKPTTTLKIFWQSETMAREPLPSQALGHTKQAPPIVDSFFNGRLTVEENSCVACHRASDIVKLSKQLITRPGPRLTDAGARMNAAWIYQWLDNPQAIRPEAVMPRLFTDDEHGRLERYAVAVYLASHGHPPAAEAVDGEAELVAHGEKLFNQTGCIVCHEKHGEEPSRATLKGLAQKTTHTALAAYLMNPATCDPAGRMPSMNLDKADATSLALYLIRRDEAASPPLQLPAESSVTGLREALAGGAEISAAEAIELATQPIEKRLAAMGRQVIESKHCANCHEFTPPGEKKPLEPSFAQHDFTAIAKAPTGGCLVDHAPDGKVPQFGSSLDRNAAVDFLKQALAAPAFPSPGEEARLTLQRMNCTGCHQRNGSGGLAVDVVAKLAENASPQMAEMVSPPPLTGVTDKLLGTYINAVLFDGRRSRPWMSLRMPQFSKPLVSVIPFGLAALDGDDSRIKPILLPENKALDEAGRTLVGAKGFGCTKCHDMLGKPSGGTRGPDLSLVADRVNFGWFDRWMIDPQRIQPGTRMPTVFLNGVSPYKDILGGDAAKQRLALWSYLSHSKSLPPPEGLEGEKPAEVVVEKSAGGYETVRSFMPDLSARAMAIRFANHVYLGIDLQNCRVAYGWSGDFLDMQPAWNDRGGQKVHLKGPMFWKSPEGFPWDVTPSATPIPDFSGREKDVSLGAILTLDAKFQPTRLDFRGYSLTPDGPTFQYELQLDGDRRAKFRETVVSLHTELANGLLRDATVQAPAGRTVWLNAAAADAAPQWSTPDGHSGQLDEIDKTAPADAVIRCTQSGKPVVLHLRGAPAGTVWQAMKQGGHWAVVVRTSPTGDATESHLVIAIMSPVNATAVEPVAAAEAAAK
jgi:cbb3-type cytochrome oxidase cytochrome c subunit